MLPVSFAIVSIALTQSAGSIAASAKLWAIVCRFQDAKPSAYVASLSNYQLRSKS